MIIIPAIDIKDGHCVRLKKGNMAEETIFSNSPREVARKWFSEGAELIHIVDLDGAVHGKPINKEIIISISKDSKDRQIQVGGGIRTFEDAKRYLEKEVSRVVLGTNAVENPDLVAKISFNYPNRVVLSVDCLGGYVMTNGWVKGTEIKPIEVLKEYEEFPLAAVIFTDISRDGMMTGPNINATFELISHSNLPIIASGGVSNLKQIETLTKKSDKTNNLYGLICGRSLYEGAFSLKDAINTAKKRQ